MAWLWLEKGALLCEDERGRGRVFSDARRMNWLHGGFDM